MKRNRAQLKKAEDQGSYRKIYLNYLYPPYNEEGWNWKRNISNHKYREFRTWKHTRQKQYKNIE
jgi:hypothetical protein